MKPREHMVGVILDSSEASRAEQYCQTAWNNWVLSGMTEATEGGPLALPQPDEEGSVRLSQFRAAKLYSFVLAASRVHLENYKGISGQHEYICDHNDPTKVSTLNYLSGLEAMMADESQEYIRAKEFAEEIGITVGHSQVLFTVQ